jgi:hypothetical protein
MNHEVGQLKVFTIQAGAGHVAISIHPEYYTVLLFPGGITNAMSLQAVGKSPLTHRAYGRAVILWVDPNKTPWTIDTASMVFATDDFTLNVSARVTTDPEARLRAGIFVPENAPGQAPGASSDDDLSAPSSSDSSEQDPVERMMNEQVIDAVLAYGRATREIIALQGYGIVSNHNPDCVEMAALRDDDDRAFVAFEMRNCTGGIYKLATVAVRDKDKVIDYTGAVRVYSPVEPPDGLLAEIPPGKRAKGMVLIEKSSLVRGPLSLNFSDVTALRPIAAQIDFIPQFPEHWFKPRISVHVQAFMGGIWLANPLDKEEIDPTTVKGLGVRIAYELSPRLLFEADLVAASTGESRFDEATYNGIQGDLVRRATLGRLSLGGMLRLGVPRGRFDPVVRLGLGLQGANHTAELEVGGVRMAGPDVGFEVSTLFLFGGGLDIRLGENFTAGFIFSATNRLNNLSGEGIRGSLEAGVHLGYSWKP